MEKAQASDLLKQIFQKDYEFSYRFESTRPESELNLLEGEIEVYEYKFQLKKISKEFLQRFMGFESIGYTSMIINPSILRTFNELMSGFIKRVDCYKVTIKPEIKAEDGSIEPEASEEIEDVNYDYENIYNLFERFLLYQSLVAKIKIELSLLKKKIIAIKRSQTDEEFTSLECGSECKKRHEKGCRFADENHPKFGKNTATFFYDYGPDFIIEGCPKDIFMDYWFIWDWYSDITYSENIIIDLNKMGFIESLVFKTIKADTQLVLEEKAKRMNKKTGGTNG